MMPSVLVSFSFSGRGSGISERIRLPVQGDLSSWQEMQPNSGPGSTFFTFCDALEVKDGASAPASGWGLEHALAAWGNYFKTVSLPKGKLVTFSRWCLLIEPPRALFWSVACPDSDVETCLGSYNPDNEFWTDTKVDK